MIRLARELLRGVPHARLHVNNGQDLAAFSDGYFDFVYSFVVFQHIPLKAIVLNYLREIFRVLKPGGILRCQLGGSSLPQEDDRNTRNTTRDTTWTGCTFTRQELTEFSMSHGFQLVALSGEDTQYMLATLRKPPGQPQDVNASNAMVNAITAFSGGSATVPQRGPGAGVTVWAGSLPDACDLNNLVVTFDGQEGSVCYVSPIGPGGACQINLLLPKNMALGKTNVQVYFSGRKIGEQFLEVIPGPPRRPAVLRLTDAVDLVSQNRITSGTLKVVICDVAKPGDVTFRLGGFDARDVNPQCTNPISEEFEYTLPIPPALRQGRHMLQVSIRGAGSRSDRF